MNSGVPAAGQRVDGRWRLTAPLGRGNQGRVWEALDPRDGAVVAIKFAPGGAGLRTEARALLSVSHPALPAVVASGTEGGEEYLVMTRATGRPLDAGLPVPVVLRALLDVADALDALHAAGRAHGDVKPANVLVSQEHTWLVDLGLSRPSDGMPAGTPAFFAPESLLGERSAATDLFALGVTAVLALTRLHPFVPDPTDTRAVVQALARGAPWRPESLQAIEPEIRAPIEALLEMDPSRRASHAGRWALHAREVWQARLGPARATERTKRAGHSLAGRAVPRVGHDREVQAVAEAVLGALQGSHDLVAAVVVGPEGSGRRRVALDALQRVRVRRSAEGRAPELEILGAGAETVVGAELVFAPDRDAADIEATIAGLHRERRYAGASARRVWTFTSREEIHGPGVLNVRVEALGETAFGALIATLAGAMPDDATVRRLWQATGGLAGALVRGATALGTPAFLDASADAWRASLGAAEPLPDGHPAAARVLDLVRRFPGGLSRASLAPRDEGLDTRTSLAMLRARGAIVESAHGLQATGPRPAPGEPGTPWLADDLAFVATLGGVLAVLAEAERAACADASTVAVRAAERVVTSCSVDAADRLRWASWLREHGDVSETVRLTAAWLTLRAGRFQEAVAWTTGCSGGEAAFVRMEAVRRAPMASVDRAQVEPDRTAFPREAALVEARRLLDAGEAASAAQRLDAIEAETLGPEAERVRRELVVRLALAKGDLAAARAAVEALGQAEGDEPSWRARTASLRGFVEREAGHARAALAAFDRAHALAIEAGDPHAAATCAASAGAAAIESGLLGEAVTWIARGAATLARFGRIGEIARSLLNAATLEWMLGDDVAGRNAASRAESAAREASDGPALALAQATWAECALEGVARAEALASILTRGAVVDGLPAAVVDEIRLRAALAWRAAGLPNRAVAAVPAATDPSVRALRALVDLEVALARDATGTELRGLRDALGTCCAEEGAADVAVLLVELCARAHASQRLGDPDDAGRLLTRHAARLDQYASTLDPSRRAAFVNRWKARAPVPAALPSGRAGAHPDLRWRRLAALQRALNGEQALRPILSRVLDAVVELTGAARAFVLLRGVDGAWRVAAARNVDRQDLDLADASFSRSIAERVAESGEPLVTVDAATDDRLSGIGSVLALHVRSVLATPLVVRGRSEGAIYVDDRFRAGAFGPDDALLVREFAETAALAIHHARTRAHLERALRRSERLTRSLETRLERSEVEAASLRRSLGSAPRGLAGHYEGIVGHGEALSRTLRTIDRVAASAVPVLLVGESGTGKELLARALHANGPRAQRRFVAENCAAIPEPLLESALFGHVRGAFTGADRNRPGLFEVADGGTLFLDEIGEMPPAMQTRLLRVLQEGEVKPVGSERVHKVDVRVVAATHRDLQAMVRAGTFREDLYYRLAVVVVPVPALRERREDIPELVAHLLSQSGGPKTIQQAALDRLCRYDWPGNVRQLQNELTRAALLADGAIGPDDLSPEIRQSAGAPPREPGTGAPASSTLRAAVDQLERDMIERALHDARGNQTRAARALGLSRFGLQKKLRRLAGTASGARDPDEQESDDPGTRHRGSA